MEKDFIAEMEDKKDKEQDDEIDKLKKYIEDGGRQEFEKEDPMSDLKGAENLPEFNEFPRGMLMIRLRQIVFQTDPQKAIVQ